MRRLAFWTCFALLALATVGFGQTHKDTRLGFQIKPPKKFEPIALKPGQSNPICQWQSEKREYGSGDRAYTSFMSTFQVSFYSSRGKPDDQSTDEWVEETWERLEKGIGFGTVLKEGDVKVAKGKAYEKQIESDSSALSYHVTVLPQDDGLFIFRGASITDRFKNYARDFDKAVKSFKRIEKEDYSDEDAELSQMDSQERRLQTIINKLPAGWEHLRTDRYLFVYNAEKNFVKDLAKQIEVIRDVYEEMYPPDRPIDDISVVRVCKDRDTYMGYGGPAGAGGHWSSGLKELVIFDMPPREATVAVLNHEAFHQYIYYFYGELSPHSWYNEGTGDYFAGADMTKTYRIKNYEKQVGGFGRKEPVKNAVRERLSGRPSQRSATPLKDLMRYSQQEYYAKSGVHYPQGWAVIHFLRESKRLPDKWDRILDDYLVSLVEARHEIAQEILDREFEQRKKKKKATDDLSSDPKDWYTRASMSRTNDIQDLAYEKTFEDWSDDDWEEFDEAWMDYVEKL
jgi:hypothetical protein